MEHIKRLRVRVSKLIIFRKTVSILIFGEFSFFRNFSSEISNAEAGQNFVMFIITYFVLVNYLGSECLP